MLLCLGKFQNIAEGKPAIQSSNYHEDGQAELAVDGISNSTGIYQTVCSQTSNNAPAWWQVDLQNVAVLFEMEIYNRLNCCSERLTDATISTKVKVNDGWKLCYRLPDMTNVEMKAFSCNKLTSARFIQVQKETYLAICEFKVFGTFYK